VTDHGAVDHEIPVADANKAILGILDLVELLRTESAVVEAGDFAIVFCLEFGESLLGFLGRLVEHGVETRHAESVFDDDFVFLEVLRDAEAILEILEGFAATGAGNERAIFVKGVKNGRNRLLLGRFRIRR
jgi:hypothetical protein